MSSEVLATSLDLLDGVQTDGLEAEVRLLF